MQSSVNPTSSEKDDPREIERPAAIELQAQLLSTSPHTIKAEPDNGDYDFLSSQANKARPKSTLRPVVPSPTTNAIFGVERAQYNVPLLRRILGVFRQRLKKQER